METCEPLNASKTPPRSRRKHIREHLMHIPHNLSSIIALIAGIAILVVPRLQHYIVAIYLIVFGILGLGILHI
jgi:uncharacterized membrane protein YdbT with pleckstrin-like domain